MNKMFFKITLFGALLFALLGTFVACSDYDDDISNLQSQIDETKTDLENLANDKIDAINSQISSLSSTQQSLQEELTKAQTALETTQADLQTALENAAKAQTEAEQAAAEAEVAKQLAQSEAAAAQAAAIAAAEKAVSDAKAELEAKINGYDLDAMSNNIATLLEANTELTTTLSTAVARLEQAESMLEAVQADIEKNAGDIQTLQEETTNLASIIETLRTEITGWNSGFDSQLLDLLEQTTTNKANIEIVETSLSEYKDLMDSRWEDMEEKLNKINNLEDELAALKEEVKEQEVLWISYTDKVVEEAVASLKAEFSNYTTEAAFEAYKNSQQETIADLKEDIAALQSNITTSNEQLKDINKEIKKINSLLSGISENFDKLITSVVLQEQNYQLIWGQFTDDVTFGPGNGITYQKDLYYYSQEGSVYVTINPNTVDITGEVLLLENSLGNTPEKFELKEAKRAEGVLVTRAAADNGFWELNVNYIPSQASSENPKDAIEQGLFAVVAQYDINDEDEDGNSIIKTKKVYSQYAFELEGNIKNAIAPDSFTLDKTEDGMTAEIRILEFASDSTSSSSKILPDRFYQQYITTADASEAALIESGIDELFEGSTREIVANDQAINKVIEFEWKGLNYDGSVIKSTISVLFSKTLFGPDEISLSHQPENNTLQTVDVNEFSNLEFIKTNGANHSAWVNNVVGQDIIEEVEGAFEIVYLDNNDTSVSELSSNTINSISKLQIKYNPENLEVGQEYTAQINYKDSLGNLVNTLNIAFTMEMPKLPSPLGGNRIPAAFNGDLTTAWAIFEGDSAVYDLTGSINDLQNEVDTLWKYAFRDATTYTPTYQPLPQLGNAVGNYTIKVPRVAIYYSPATVNTEDYSPKTYTLKEGVEFYNIPQLFNQFDEFQINFKSAVNWADFTMAPIEVDYGDSIIIDSTYIDSQDPSVAYTKQINYLNYQTEIEQTEIDSVTFYVDDSDSNKGLISNIDFKEDGTLTFYAIGNVALQSNADVNIIMEVTDKFNIVTRHEFQVTVIAPSTAN